MVSAVAVIFVLVVLIPCLSRVGAKNHTNTDKAHSQNLSHRRCSRRISLAINDAL